MDGPAVETTTHDKLGAMAIEIDELRKSLMEGRGIVGRLFEEWHDDADRARNLTMLADWAIKSRPVAYKGK